MQLVRKQKARGLAALDTQPSQWLASGAGHPERHCPPILPPISRNHPNKTKNIQEPQKPGEQGQHSPLCCPTTTLSRIAHRARQTATAAPCADLAGAPWPRPILSQCHGSPHLTDSHWLRASGRLSRAGCAYLQASPARQARWFTQNLHTCSLPSSPAASASAGPM